MIQSSSYFQLIYSGFICFFSSLLFSPNICAQANDINYKVGALLYNPKDKDGNVQENIKPYINLGLQYKITDVLGISLDSYISDEANYYVYFAGSVDYTYKVNDQYGVFVQAGVDVLGGDIIPKAGFGIIGNISKKTSITIGTQNRLSDKYSDRQFEIGFVYNFLRKAPFVMSSLASTTIFKDSNYYPENKSMNYLRYDSNNNLRKINELIKRKKATQETTEFYIRSDLYNRFDKLQILVDGIQWNIFELDKKEIVITEDTFPKGSHLIRFVLSREKSEGNTKARLSIDKIIRINKNQGKNFTLSVVKSHLGDTLDVKEW